MNQFPTKNQLKSICLVVTSFFVWMGMPSIFSISMAVFCCIMCFRYINDYFDISENYVCVVLSKVILKTDSIEKRQRALQWDVGFWLTMGFIICLFSSKFVNPW